MGVPIAEQIQAVEIASRQAMTQTTLDALTAAQATLEIVSKNADGLRTLIRFLQRQPRWTQEEAAALVAHPAVKALLDAFPEAIIASIRPVHITADDDEAGDAD